MASQLALLFVRRLKVPVVLTDLDQERADKGVAYVHAEIDKLLAKGGRPGQGQPPQGPGHRLDRPAVAFADADFVIEAVFEEMSVKKQVFAEVEKVVSPECVLATNTSSLSITEMATDLEHPERVVGFHFFNPVAVMPLLEIVRGEQTDDADAGHGIRHRQAWARPRSWSRTARLHRQPPPRPLHGRGRPDRRRGHAGDGRGLAPSPARADAAVHPALARRPGDRAAQQRDAARRVPGALLRLPGLERWSRPQAGALRRRGAIDPEVAALWCSRSRPWC